MLNASKWLSFYLLLDPNEWENFFQQFDLYLINVSQVCQKGQHLVDKMNFIQAIKEYTKQIKTQHQIDVAPYRGMFSCALSQTLDAIDVHCISQDKVIAKPVQPIIQMRPCFGIITSNNEVKLKARGKEAFSWGIELSFPQMVQDSITKKILNALTDSTNGPIFKEMMRWIRKHTCIVSLETDNQKFNTMLRIGKQVQSWKNEYQPFVSKQIKII